jgi:hypothetical protein
MKPPLKPELQQQTSGGTPLGNSNPPGPIKLCSQSTADVGSALLCALRVSTNYTKMLGQNHAGSTKLGCFDFFFNPF